MSTAPLDVLHVPDLPAAPRTWVGAPRPSRIPDRAPGPGEQYRFSVNMTACVGCRCCEVACHEQNQTPPNVKWRRVGELESGVYPDTTRLFLSMGCNHCVDPACLTGCPVEAYVKLEDTGVVVHEDDTCIGCRYCTWNCPYGVPQYDASRNIVTKCDLCHERLADGDEPACVAACPAGALTVEIVNVAEWKADMSAGNAPGVPDVSGTISTTRFTVPEDAPRHIADADARVPDPEEPHTPLIVMTVLTQLSVGAMLTMWLTDVLAGVGFRWQPLAAFLVGVLALGASTLHLGRPIHAVRAFKMWRRSWLSREAFAFTAFAGAASVYAAAALFALPAIVEAGAGALAVVLGLLGILCSAYIYKVPARPAWDTYWTHVSFGLTAAILGPSFAFAMAVVAGGDAMPPRDMLAAWMSVAAVAAVGQLLARVRFAVNLLAARTPELTGTARLLFQRFGRLFLARLACTLVGVMLLPGWVLAHMSDAAATMSPAPVAGAALACACAGELLDRYLFFVTVVPKRIPDGFFDRVGR